MIQLLGWIATITSLIGAYYNVKMNRVGFKLWTASSVLLIIYGLITEQYFLMVLQSAYMYLNILGLKEWKK